MAEEKQEQKKGLLDALREAFRGRRQNKTDRKFGLMGGQGKGNSAYADAQKEIEKGEEQ